MLMSIASTLLAHKKTFAAIAALAIVAAYMIPYVSVTDAFAARGGGGGSGSGGQGGGGGGGGGGHDGGGHGGGSGGGGCKPYCHVKP